MRPQAATPTADIDLVAGKQTFRSSARGGMRTLPSTETSATMAE
jgi:hypothetical protein